jgi:hypothetical protein
MRSTPRPPAPGMETTWRQGDDECRNGVAERPPIWHAGQEVEETAVRAAPQHRVPSSAMDNRGVKSPLVMYSAGCSRRSPRRKSRRRLSATILLALHHHDSQAEEKNNSNLSDPCRTRAYWVCCR